MSRKKSRLATLLAPEDIRRDHYVAVLNEIEQYFPCCFDLRQPEPVNIRMLPADAPEPLRVFEVCLPFVTARRPNGSLITLDVRRHELARLEAVYARRVIKGLKRPKPKTRGARAT